MKLAARVRRVLRGDSPVALLHAVTGDGLELKLEVPAADAAATATGDVLVLEWDTFHLDDPREDVAVPTAPADPDPGDAPPRASVRRLLRLPPNEEERPWKPT